MRPRKYIFFFYWVIKYYTQIMMKVFLKASINIDKIFRWTFHFPVQYTQNIWASFCCVVGIACTFFITFSRWFFLPWHYCWKSEQDPCRSTLFDEGWKYSIRMGGGVKLWKPQKHRILPLTIWSHGCNVDRFKAKITFWLAVHKELLELKRVDARCTDALIARDWLFNSLNASGLNQVLIHFTNVSWY